MIEKYEPFQLQSKYSFLKPTTSHLIRLSVLHADSIPVQSDQMRLIDFVFPMDSVFDFVTF
jgi:hypothetical protein